MGGYGSRFTVHGLRLAVGGWPLVTCSLVCGFGRGHRSQNGTYGTHWTYGNSSSKAPTANCKPPTANRQPQKSRAARVFLPSGLRFPFGYVVCGSSPHWLAMFDGTSAPSGLEAVPSRTNHFRGRGFREMRANPRILFFFRF